MKSFLRGLLLGGGLLAGTVGWANEPLPAPDPRHTPLHVAAEQGQADDLRTLLQAIPAPEAKARLDQPDREGLTPLGYAARGGSLDCVRLLLAAGATPGLAAERSRWTALHEAADQGHAAVVHCLLEAGAPADALTQDGRSPLTLALAGPILTYGPPGDRRATLAVLLAHGANPEPLLAYLERCEQLLAEQKGRIEEEERSRQRLTEEVHRLQERLAAIESAVGNPGVRPLRDKTGGP